MFQGPHEPTQTQTFGFRRVAVDHPHGIDWPGLIDRKASRSGGLRPLKANVLAVNAVRRAGGHMRLQVLKSQSF